MNSFDKAQFAYENMTPETDDLYDSIEANLDQHLNKLTDDVLFEILDERNLADVVRQLLLAKPNKDGEVMIKLSDDDQRELQSIRNACVDAIYDDWEY